jgi:hypothetical protein
MVEVGLRNTTQERDMTSLTAHEDEIAKKAAKLIDWLWKENQELQVTLDDIQAVAIDPLMVEMNRLRVEFDDVNDALQLHQTNGAYEAGQHFAGKAIEAELKRLRRDNNRLQGGIKALLQTLDGRQELITLLNDQNSEKNKEIEKLQQMVREREADCHSSCLPNLRLQEEIRKLRSYCIREGQTEQDFLTLKKEKNSLQILLEMERGQLELSHERDANTRKCLENSERRNCAAQNRLEDIQRILNRKRS